MNTECYRIREELQNICDENLEIPYGIRNHIKTCPGCKEYWAVLSSLGTSLAEEIDEKLKTMAPPDFGLIHKKKKRRRHNRLMPVAWGIAVVFVLSLGIFINSLLSTHQKNAE